MTDGKKVIDAFIFYNELDLLDLKLHEHDSFVDYFVLVESRRAFNNQPKSLYYDENKERFAEFHSKIIHVIVDDAPDTTNSWSIEFFVRNATLRGVLAVPDLKMGDWIILSDLDEIIRAETFNKTLFDSDKVYKFDMSFRYYKFNCRATSGSWPGAIMVPASIFTSCEAQNVRHHGGNPLIPDSSIVYVPNAGWHLSYMGGVDKIVSKINTGGHQELNTDQIKDAQRIAQRLKYGEDIFDRPDCHWEYINDDDYPRYVLDNKDTIYKDYFLPMNRYKFQLVIPFSDSSDDGYGHLNWALSSSLPEISKYIELDTLHSLAPVIIVNNSGVSIDRSKIHMDMQYYDVEDLIEPMLISQTLNWAIKRARMYGHSFMMWMHDDAALKANALKLMIDKYEEVRGTKWGTIYLAKDGDVCSFYNPEFNYSENVWYEPMLFPVYMMDSHYFRVMRLRGWTMEYANWDHSKDWVIHEGSHTLKNPANAFFKAKNDLIQESLRLTFKKIWNCQPEDPISAGSQDSHAKGTC